MSKRITNDGERSRDHAGRPLLAAVLLLASGAQAATGGAPPVRAPAWAAPSIREAQSLPLTPPTGLDLDAAGDAYVAGTLFSRAPVVLGGRTLAATADGSLVVSSLSPAGSVCWVEDIASVGDAAEGSGGAQLAAGPAVTLSGRVVVAGRFSGRLAFGATKIESARGAGFLAGLDAATGRRAWIRRLDAGSNGAITAVATNPRSASNRIAVCGQASAPATDLVPGARFGGGIHDVVIGVFDPEGNRLWSAQLGGAGYESCTAVAVDDNGDVYAAGQLSAATLTFPGSTPVTVAGPGTALRKAMWVARFRGAGRGGAPEVVSAAVFQGAAGQVRPSALTVEPGGALLVAGQFSSSLSLGKEPCGASAAPGPTCLVGAGATDAFAARLDPGKDFAATWAVRLGGTGRDEAYGVAASTTGDVVVVGRVSTSLSIFRSGHAGRDTSGAASLSTSGTGNPDAFVLRLDAKTGATRYAATYGDGTFQQAEAVAVSRSGAAADRLAIVGTLGGSAAFGTAARIKSTVEGGLGAFLLLGRLESTR